MLLLVAGGLCMALAAALLLPGLLAGPSLDAAVFALVGALTRHGQLPYVDTWDHKPPVIFGVDALAQAVLPWLGPWAAAWVTSVVTLGGAGVLVFVVLRRGGLGWEALMAGAATTAAASQLLLALGGGLTESAAILPAAAAIWLAMAGSYPALVGAGAVATLAALTSIPMLPASVAVAIIAWRSPVRGRGIVAAVAGGVLTGLAAAGVLAATGMLPAALDQVVGYSAAFRALGAAGTGSTAQMAAATLTLVFLLLPAALGALAARRAADRRTRTLALASGGWVGVALLLFVFEGRFETHYAATLCVPLGLLSGPGIRRAWTVRGGALPRSMAVAPLAAGLAVSALVAGLNLPTMVRPVAAETARTRAVATLVDAETAPEATIFVWGNEPQIYLWSGRSPASRYIYVYPLTTPGYSSAAQVDELVAHLRDQPPDLIIDAGSFGLGTPGLPPLLVNRPVDTGDPRTLDLIQPLRDLVRADYELLTSVDGWPVYHRRAIPAH